MCCKSFSLLCVNAFQMGRLKLAFIYMGKPVVYVGVVFGDQKVTFELGNGS